MGELYISEIFQSSSVTDAVIATGFFSDCDALAVAKGNHLLLYQIQNQQLSQPITYEFYGEIIRLIVIQYSDMSVGNLMVILKDFQSCLLSADEYDFTKIINLSHGAITDISNELLNPPKYALHPHALVLQTSNVQFSVYPITPESTLEAPFLIDVACKAIIDFHFVGPTSKVKRLAVLTEEFNKAPNLRLITIDTTEQKYSEDIERVALPLDTYCLLPYDPETKALIVAFSFNKAIRVSYENLKPDTTTATIFTNSPLKMISPLQHDLYLAIDEDCFLKTGKIQETGPVPLADICRCPYPTSIATISNSLAFISSRKDDSMIYKFEQGQPYELFERIRSTGPSLNFFKDDNILISIFKRAVVEFNVQSNLTILETIACENFSKVFPFSFNGHTCYLLSSFKDTQVIGLNSQTDMPSLRLDKPTFLFSQITEKLFLQITNSEIILMDNEKILTELEQNILTASINELTFCISNAKTVDLYKINPETNTFENRYHYVHSQRNEIITSCSTYNQYLAISFSNSLYVYDLNKSQLQKFEINGPIIDLMFAFDKLICLNVVDFITVVDYKINETIEIRNSRLKQLNTRISKLNDHHVLICGQKPFAINSNLELASLSSEPILDATVFDNSFISINCEKLMIGQIQPPEFCSKSFFSETAIVDIFKYKDLYITIRKSEKDLFGLFISSERLNIVQNFNLEIVLKNSIIQEKSDDDPFFIFNSPEEYKGYHIENNNFFIATTNRIIRFRIEIELHLMNKIVRLIQCGESSCAALSKLNESVSKKAMKEIRGFGTFRDFPYIQFSNRIDFFNVNITNPSDCSFQYMFCLTFREAIQRFTFSYQLAVIYTDDHCIVSFAYDDFKECFIPLVPYRTSHLVTAMSIIGRKILCGTQSGILFTLEHVCSTNSTQSDLTMNEAISIDQHITSIKTFDDINLVLIGTVDGMIIALRSIKGETTNQSKFNELYDLLENKITSLGGFSKHFQRVPKVGRSFLKPNNKMFDFDLIKKFLAMPRNEQEKILGSKMSIEEAQQLLNIDFLL